MSEVVQALADLDPDAVRAEVEEFLGSEHLEDETVEALLFMSDTCRRAHLPELALNCLERAAENFEPNAALYEKFGFTHLDMGNETEAEAAFNDGLALSPDAKGAQLGVYHCLVRRGESAEALKAIVPLFDWEEMYHPPGVAKTLQPLTHKAYIEGRRVELLDHYRFLKKHIPDDSLITIRLTDILNKTGQFEAARELTREREGDLSVDPWCAAIMTETYIGLGEMHNARRLALPLLSREDFHPHFLHVYLRGFTPEETEALNADAILGHFISASPETKALAGMSVHLRAHNPSAAYKAYLSNEDHLRNAAPYSIIELAYALLADGQNDKAAKLCADLRRDKLLPHPVEMLDLNILFATQDWARALAVMDEITPTTPDEIAELNLKKFELACFTGDWETAENMHTNLLNDPELVTRYLPSILRFHAEKKEWNIVCDVILGQRPEDFQFAQIGMIVFRAFTDSDRVSDAMAWISRAGSLREHPDLRQLRASLIDEISVDHQSIKQALSDSDVKAFPVIRRRLELKRGMLAKIESHEVNRTDVIYFCTNKSYRCGTAVAVMSLIRSNPDLARQSQIQIVTDEEDGLSIEVFSRLGEQHDVDIDVLAATDFITDFDNLDASYGIFTSGFQLSQSAYYRIFFAKYLQERRNIGRAIYFDSDILITGDILPLLSEPLNNNPLAARREIIRPEILKASAMHGIEPQDYFNSGVLLFDMVHPAMGDCLDRTIKAVYNDQLLFHDQCALNIGFANEVHYFDERYNYFMPPSNRDDLSKLDASVVHYLDRPKPWNAAYTHAAGLTWLDNLDALSATIGSELVSRMFLK